MTLKELGIGQSAKILDVGGEGNLRQHFLDMGIISGETIKLLKLAPMGDPMEFLINGYSLSLRLSDAAKITVEPTDEVHNVIVEKKREKIDEAHHPGLGEEGKFHNKEGENPLPKGTLLNFAIVGNQNSGKTALFNQLTGENQHVGNFPGVTVDRIDKPVKGHPNTFVTDLPGIYSLSPYSSQESVSRKFILEEKPKGIINIVDAGNLERNLYLTTQLMELGIPMVLALNMMDEVRGNGGTIRINEMESILGIPVIPVSVTSAEGVNELLEHAVHVAKYQEKPERYDICDKDSFGGAVHRCIHSIIHLIDDHAERAGIPVRFAAVKLIEGDKAVENALSLDQNEKEMLEHIIVQMESERGLDRNAAIADMRYHFIHDLCAKTVVKPHESKEQKRSANIDKVLTGRWTAIPIFIFVMVMVIWLTIDVFGTPLQNCLETGINWLASVVDKGMANAAVNAPVRSLVKDGLFGGVGSVLSFVPIIILLFFFLSLLEDSGYMSRVAFVTDKLIRKLGLSGRSIVPLLIGFGCSVPAVMATRTLPSARDRRKTILLTPFMSCSGKLPVYAFFSNAFFPGHGGLVLASLYLFAVMVGVVIALVAKHIGKNSKPSPFIMELPPYRLPSLKNVAHLLWDKTKDFIQRAFTIILVATVIIWFLQSFNFKLSFVTDSSQSILAWFAGILAPLFSPIGLGDWRIVTALISGFLAKESVVSTMEVLGVAGMLSTASAISMLVFCLLYTPCIAAIAAVRRELGRKWALIMVLFQCIVAWIFAGMVFLIVNQTDDMNFATMLVILGLATALFFSMRGIGSRIKSPVCDKNCSDCMLKDKRCNEIKKIRTT